MTKQQKEELLQRALEALVLEKDSVARMVDHLYSQKPLFEEGGPFSELLQKMVNLMLEGEMDDFLKSERIQGKRNKRNGHTDKTVLSHVGPLEIRTPRDRHGDFEPQLVQKRQRVLSSGIDHQILALYAQGNSVEDVRRLLRNLYGISISAGKISAITDRILPEIQAWRERQLRSLYVVVYLDAVHFKVRYEGHYVTRALYTVYGIDAEGQRDLLGLYIDTHEGASRWGRVLEDLKERGVEDVLIFSTDDLSGFSQAILEVYPRAIVQKCIVHKVRSSTRFVDTKDQKALRQDLRAIYRAANREAARTALEAFRVKWGHKYERVAKSWERDWDELMAFMDFPKELRRLIYTTNPVEAVHRIIRKLIKGKAAWVSDTALIKQVYLSLMYNERSWRRSVHGWTAIERQLVELYGERFTRHLSTP